MIVGAKYWNDRERYYSQVNNPTEEQLKKHGVKAYLETCGPTATVMCLDALGYVVKITTPGGHRPQPEEVLSDFFSDPNNYPKFKLLRPDWDVAGTPNNRVAEFYPWAVLQVFGALGVAVQDLSKARVVTSLCNSNAVQLCLNPPGHYVAVVAYDKATEELIYHDPWPGRNPTWFGNGFSRRMTKVEEDAIQGYGVVYTGGG